MKNRRIRTWAFLGVIIIATLLSSYTCINHKGITKQEGMVIQKSDYGRQWTKVDSLIQKGLPKSALEIVEQIYNQTKIEGDSPQFIKAVLYKIKLTASYEEEFMEKIIADINEEVAQAGSPDKQVLHSVLADLYWRYYTQNRYKVLDRTTTDDFKTDDLRSWDLTKIVDAALNNYLLSLENKHELQDIQLNDYKVILINEEQSKVFRPTLYDFLAHRAVDYFIQEEPGLTEPVYKFVVGNPEYFSSGQNFIKINITSRDTLSLKYYAMKVFQDLIRFHLEDKTPGALIDVELKRAQFVYDKGVMAHKDSLYIESLQNLLDEYADSPSSSEVSYKLAQAFNQRGEKYDPLISEQYKWDKKRAVQYCKEAIDLFPGSIGAGDCEVLLNRIQHKSIGVTTEYVNVESRPFLSLIKYTNISDIYVRIIRINPEKDKELRQQRDRENMIKSYVKEPFLKEWEIKLIDDGDFQEHSTEIKTGDFPLGYYVMLVSSNPQFVYLDEPVSFSSFWVSNISFINRDSDQGNYDFYVLHRDQGTPLKDVFVETFYKNYDYKSRSYETVPWKNYSTDENGFFSVEPPPSRTGGKSFSIKFSYGDDTLITDEYFYIRHYSAYKPEAKPKTFFFTDRAIYRPGQTVYFKGIVVDTDGKTSQLITEYQTNVVLNDVNWQKISSLELNTSEFGSFNGSFVIPTGILTGRMTIKNKSGSTQILVEEYKRPRFEVVFEPVKGSYKLNEEVTVTGHAKSYAGANLDQAEVKYRVVRTARYPYRGYWWRGWYPGSPDMEITNGVTTTDENGKFPVTFVAIPDEQVSSRYKPVFDYTVYADVTDINGETQSTVTTVSVSTTALILHVEIPELINKDKVEGYNLFSTNLNGEKVSCSGNLIIQELIEPEQLFRKRSWERPDRYIIAEGDFRKEFPFDVYKDEDIPGNWQRDSTMFEWSFNTENDSILDLSELSGWKPGHYMLKAVTTDIFGEKVEVEKYIVVFSTGDSRPAVHAISWFADIIDHGEPGEKASLLIGTAGKDVRMLYEVVHDKKTIRREWIELNNEQKLIEIPIEERFRGNFEVNFVFVKHNRAYLDHNLIKVPYTNKELDISFSTFRNKLLPGQDEEWQITIKDKAGERVAAEMLASMYDASLDAFVSHSWAFNLLHAYYGSSTWDIQDAFNSHSGLQYIKKTKETGSLYVRKYDQLNWFGFNFYGYRDGLLRSVATKAGGEMMGNVDEVMAVQDDLEVEETEAVPLEGEAKETVTSQPSSGLEVRRDFRETAFFFPNLRTNDEGDVVISFKAPESLTRWKIMGLAHTKELKYALIEKELVTQKELMVVPNAPRFFREGDTLWFSTKVVNLSDNDLEGVATLEFFDAVSMAPVSIMLDPVDKSIQIEKGQSRVVSWEIAIPMQGLQAITYRATARAGNFSDGEEMALPVLTNRMLVTESLPMPVKGGEEKQFSFKKLIDSEASKTLVNHKLTLEFTSNPAWYAVQALPYLMEYPYECSEQIFSRYYANSIASHIVNSNPKTKRVFDSWREYTPDALLSNLEKNQELKSLMLEETPWVLDAKNETERKQRVALLFDLNNMSYELSSALLRLQNLQSPNGGWPWFKGMPDSRYITRHIVAGFGKLNHLMIKDAVEDDRAWKMLRKAVLYLDDRIREDYEKVKQYHGDKMDEKHIGQRQIHYLYARSFYNTFNFNINVSKRNKEAFDYYLGQAETYWTEQSIYMQGMTALALYRYGDDRTSGDIIKSMKERALHSEEMGMYWRGNPGYFWYQAPIETQALLIEAFDEIAEDNNSVEEMKIWLLKQKQTQNWETTKATVEAVYALLLRGTDLLASDKLVKVELGGRLIDPTTIDDLKVEAGTGYFKTSWSGNEITPDMGKVTVSKEDEGIAWGALYWQYFEQLDKITTHETPLKLDKKLFIERNTPSGPVLDLIDEKTKLEIGDKVIVRIELRVDRDMEYVHMKDMRASAFEPINVLSGYRYQGGLGYYESTRDASTNFFIGYLAKGTYVFEYPLVASQAGDFSNGITTIQCMYAPEFTSHSEGIRVSVRMK